MNYIFRTIEQTLNAALARGKSILLLGARQTGKTTLLSRLKADFSISLIQPHIRQSYERNPSLLIQEVEALAENSDPMPLVIIDEVQKVPEILDAVQDLIDRRLAKFILTGSSARKLRLRSKINLLPGRVVVLKLDPLSLTELSSQKITLEHLLLYGSLPGILNVPDPKDKEIDLRSYVSTYLEEEIRAEATVRNVGSFSKFLLLAAAESGEIVNFRKLSQEIGIAHTTIAAYYQILEDCLIGERIEPMIYTKTKRKLIKASKYIFFDLGVRRLSAEEGDKLPEQHLGKLFEQWVGLELLRCARVAPSPIKIHFWRDSNGPEVDWIIASQDRLIPIEVKWTDHPTLNDAKHLYLFKREYEHSGNAYIVCRIPRKIKLAEGVYAIPWQTIDELLLSEIG